MGFLNIFKKSANSQAPVSAAHKRLPVEDMHAFRISEDVHSFVYYAVVRGASVSEYADWLEGYIKRGEGATHFYDYNMNGRGGPTICIAGLNGTLPTLYGAESLKIIVPMGVSVGSEPIGHNEIFYMDGFREAGNAVPVYADVLQEMERRGYTRNDLEKGISLQQQPAKTPPVASPATEENKPIVPLVLKTRKRNPTV